MRVGKGRLVTMSLRAVWMIPEPADRLRAALADRYSIERATDGRTVWRYDGR